ncbi:MAG: FkbM family methyltransferase [Chitinophagales bacterium]
MKKLIRLFLQQFGYDIVKYKAPFVRGKLGKAAFQQEFSWLSEYHFKTIIDIGANEGQFSDKIRILFPEAKIFAFEPLPAIYENLKLNFSNDQKFIAFNLGLGDKPESLEFWENEYSPSSSFLSLADSHRDNFQEAIQVQQVRVQVKTLDQVFAEETVDLPLLIKIDVQGFEDKVIRGGIETIKKASLIICELSFVELYKGQPKFRDLFREFDELGFDFSGNIEQLRASGNNAILQADGIFVKRK